MLALAPPAPAAAAATGATLQCTDCVQKRDSPLPGSVQGPLHARCYQRMVHIIRRTADAQAPLQAAICIRH